MKTLSVTFTILFIANVNRRAICLYTKTKGS